MLATVQMAGFADRKPKQLSGAFKNAWVVILLLAKLFFSFV